jgi:hypothetical protein
MQHFAAAACGYICSKTTSKQRFALPLAHDGAIGATRRNLRRQTRLAAITLLM